MIDKTAYFFWQGEQMSWLRYMTLYSFSKYNPKWRCILYICDSEYRAEKNWDTVEVQNDQAYPKEKTKNYIQELKNLNIEIRNYKSKDKLNTFKNSDIFQWDILSEKSGFYFDMDIMFVSPMDKIYERCCNTDAYISYFNGDFSIGSMASSGKNMFFKDLYDRSLLLKDDCYGYQGTGKVTVESIVMDKINSGIRNYRHRTQVLEEAYPNINFYNTERDVYPFNWDNDAARFYDVHNNIQEEGFLGIHWYGGRPVSQRFNEMLDEDTFFEHKNTICYYAKKAYEL